MKTRVMLSVLAGAMSVPLAVATAAPASSAGGTVECSLKLKYRIHTEWPSVDAVDRYVCEGKVMASSDVDAIDVKTRQVVFKLDNCPRLPATVAFGDRDVTEVRKLRGHRVRAHVFAGECLGCAMAVNTGASDPRLDAGHFDAVFAVRPLEPATADASILLPAGKGSLTLRAERTDDMIVTGAWVARACKIVPRPPIFCGGIAGIPCPDGLVCVDWPGDDCDPDAGGADCIGVCVNPGP